MAKFRGELADARVWRIKGLHKGKCWLGTGMITGWADEESRYRGCLAAHERVLRLAFEWRLGMSWCRRAV